MDMRPVSAEPARINYRTRLKLWLAYNLGRCSRQFRENWHHATGTWLWGLSGFIRSTPFDSSQTMSSDEWNALLEDIFKKGSNDKMAFLTPSGHLVMRSSLKKLSQTD